MATGVRRGPSRGGKGGQGGQARTRLARTAVAQAARALFLARAGALRPGLRERDAADIIHALMSPEVCRLLVGDRRWPPQRYERWLADTLISQLLGGAAGPATARD